MVGESRHSISEREVLIGLGSASQEGKSFVLALLQSDGEKSDFMIVTTVNYAIEFLLKISKYVYLLSIFK